MSNRITKGTVECTTAEVKNLKNGIEINAEGTNNVNDIYAKKLVKEVTITEWNELQDDIHSLQNQINTLIGAVNATNKEGK